jgi:hypothetical protein
MNDGLVCFFHELAWGFKGCYALLDCMKRGSYTNVSSFRDGEIQFLEVFCLSLQSGRYLHTVTEKERG